jgi:hypothetical protein
MHLDITRSSNEHAIRGIPVGRLLAINPLAPFQILFIISFLYLYAKHSKYAWHAIAMLLLSTYPMELIFRAAGVYFLPYRYAFENWLWPTLHVGVLIYLLGLRKRYISFLSSQQGDEKSEREEQQRPT